MAAARAFLEGEHEARRQLAAELAPHAEVLCRRYLPDSVKLYRQWRVLTVQSENEYSMTVELKGPARGTWKNKATGYQGDLLDLIRIDGKHHDGIAATMAAAHAFLETQAEVQRQLDAKLEPHAEALCQSYLPLGVEQDGQWREEQVTVELEGPARGTWRNDITGHQGALLDLIRIEGKHFDNITAAMAEAHAFLHGEAQVALRHDWKAHDERALEAGNPLYHTPEYHQLIGRTQDLVQAYTTLQDPYAFFNPQHLEQRIAAHQAHQRASLPLQRHADAANAHEQAREPLRNEPRKFAGAHPVFNGQYPQWRREAEALIAQGRKLLETPGPAQLAETNWLRRISRTTETLERTIHDDARYHQSHQALNAELAPHAEALCRRFLPNGVEQDGRWRVPTVRDGEKHAMYVRLSGPAQGTWEDETAARRGDLLDIIRHTATGGDVTEAMAAARAFLEAQLRQQHKTAQDLEQKQTKHKSRSHRMRL